MAYNHTYINKLEQFSSVSYTLILEDQDGIMPPIRNDKYFLKSEYPNLSQSDLIIEAKKDIDTYTQMYEDEIDFQQQMEDQESENQVMNESLMNNLRDAVDSGDPKSILESVYSLLKNNSLDEKLSSIVDTLEDAKVVQVKDPIKSDLSASAELVEVI